LERKREFLDNHDRRISGPSLHVADVGAVNPRLLCQRFLAQAEAKAEMPDVPAKASSNIHAAT
jgi:hypothetical protein